MPDRLPITPSLSLDPAEIVIAFIRASGPGGQNVNKVSTAAQLHFDLRHSPSLPEPVKTRAARLPGSRLSNDGVLVITPAPLRTQPPNRADAGAPLLEMLAAAPVPPKPPRPPPPALASKQRRLEGKSQRSGVKQLRRIRPSEE